MQKSITSTLLIFATLLSINGYSQKTLDGLVINEDGEELIGVSVQRNSKNIYYGGTTTDLKGVFQIVLSQTDTMRLSYVGYKDKLVSFQDLSFDNLIMLEETDYDLGTVVVTGYRDGLRICSCNTDGCGLTLRAPKRRTITLEIQIEGEKWKVFPNPTTSNVTIQSEYTKTGSIELFNADGQLLQRYPANKREELLNLDGYPAGIYYLRHLIEDKSRFIGKVVKVD